MKNKEIGNYAVSCLGKSRDQVGCSGSHDWCANFVSYVLNKCGIKITNYFVGPLRDDLLKSGLFYEPEDYPQFGDIMEIDFDHKVEVRPLDHVVIVKKYDEYTGKVTYISGNGNSSTYVTEETVTLDEKYMFWQRYKEDANSETDENINVDTKTETASSCNIDMPVLMSGCTGTAVKNLQRLLIGMGYSCGPYGDDSEFGEKTEEAVRNYQKGYEAEKLESDGIVGPKTWSTLFPVK